MTDLLSHATHTEAARIKELEAVLSVTDTARAEKRKIMDRLRKRQKASEG